MSEILFFVPICLFASFLTYTLIHKYHWNTIRASTIPTLFFALIFQQLDLPSSYQALFFGATFIGMSNEKRLGKLEVLFSSLLFVTIYTMLIGFFQGPGGVLGALAFLATSTTWFLKKYFLRLRTNNF